MQWKSREMEGVEQVTGVSESTTPRIVARNKNSQPRHCPQRPTEAPADAPPGNFVTVDCNRIDTVSRHGRYPNTITNTTPPPECRTVSPPLAPHTQDSSNVTGKRNTSRAVFTSHERTLARQAWGSGTARLSRESFLPFGSCCLCLEPAIDPVACIHGDIFCRECALSNILAQKKEIKRLDRAREQEEREAQEDQARRGLEEQSRAVQEFELTQAGLDSQRRKSSAQVEDGGGSTRGEKRKFSIDEDEVLRIASQERSKARRAIDDEKVASPLQLFTYARD